MFQFQTDLHKKIQAAAVLLRLEQNRMDRLRLLKLLYIADRESLKETGKPIVGGRILAMRHGPIHSELDDLTKGQHANEATWSNFLTNEGHRVILQKDPGRLDLSPYEIEKLTEVSNRYATVDTWELADETLNFEEFTQCHQPGAARSIPLETILSSLGFTLDEIADLKKEVERHHSLRREFDRELSTSP